MKNIFSFFTLCFCLISISSKADLRSDTIDIKHTFLKCNITNFTTKEMFAEANIKILSKINSVNQINLDLEGLQVDSVKWNGTTNSFVHVGAKLHILFPTILNINDSATLQIFYHGVPITDASWGGFYFVGNFAFQMGVGFDAQPHSFGRTWHPCFDNFVERSSYEFLIETEASKMATCNGILLDSLLLGNGNKTWHWKLDETIPSYLASVAVSNYVLVNIPLTGSQGTIDGLIACQNSEINNVNGSFANLQKSFTMLENNYGNHQFPRVGYSLVPFSAGAMEHATNIHIGQAYINGSLTYETLIAHELAHHWWGDLVTCKTAGDMWLNEGFASYSENLHTEFVYGNEDYKKAVRATHFNVLQNAHFNDEGYKSVANMDSLHTYGTTVYQKGADVLNTMRFYLGDSLFFNGLKSFLNTKKFSAISSLDLQNYLSTFSGKNMSNFFNDFIFQAGFPHYGIDSTKTTFAGIEYNTSVFLRHRKHQAPNYFNEMPIEIGVYDDKFILHIFNVPFSGRCLEYQFKTGFEPKCIVIDPNNKISDAVTDEEIIINGAFTKIFTEAKARLIVNNINSTVDSSLFRIEHHWIMPDRFKQNPGNVFVLNDKRFWKIDGINLNALEGVIEFKFNANSGEKYIDSSWIKNKDDSIRLFHRKDASEDWKFASDSLRVGSLTDKSGSIYLTKIEKGEYCFGIQRSGYNDMLQSDVANAPCQIVVKLNDPKLNLENQILIFPNPTNGELNIESQFISPQKTIIQLYDILGRQCWQKNIDLETGNQKIYFPLFQNGIYFIEIINKDSNLKLLRQKIIIEK